MSESAGRPIGFLWPLESDPLRGPQPIVAAPSHAPYPSTVPLLPPPAGDATPWWSERVLLKALGNLTLLRLYTQPAALVQ
jgi:hypothetical protein